MVYYKDKDYSFYDFIMIFDQSFKIDIKPHWYSEELSTHSGP